MENKTELEAEFKKSLEEFKKESQSLFEAINGVEEKLIQLSEKHGIPFESSLSCLINTYTPKSYFQKFKELSRGFVENEVQLYEEYSLEWPGWAHSAVC